MGFFSSLENLKGKDLIRNLTLASKTKPQCLGFKQGRSWATHKRVSCCKFFSGKKCVSLIGVMAKRTSAASPLPRVTASMRNGNVPFLCTLKGAQWGDLRSSWLPLWRGQVWADLGQQGWAATCWLGLSSSWTSPGDSIRESAASSNPWPPLMISREGNESPKSIMTLN